MKKLSRPEPPPHRKFGYAAVIEKAAIRQRLLDDGVTDPVVLFFQTEQTYVTAHANDPPYRDRSRQVSPVPAFSHDDLRFLIDHFAKANDPAAISVHDKAKAILNVRTQHR
jgi:hypothetical protein